MSQDREEQRRLLEHQIHDLNEHIKQLGSRLEGILNVDCSLGVCAYDPEVDDIHEKISEVQKKTALLKQIRDNLDSCNID